jgi:glycine/serine hydroxymethyltransferase
MLNPDLRRVAERLHFGDNSTIDLTSGAVALSPGCQDAFNMFSNISYISERQANLHELFVTQLKKEFEMEHACACSGTLSPSSVFGNEILYDAMALDDNGFVDYELTRQKITRYIEHEHPYRTLLVSNTGYPRLIDWNVIADIASDLGLKVIADIGETTGLILSGLNFNPAPWVDAIIGRTSGTMGGTDSTFIVSRNLIPTQDLCPLAASELAANIQAVYELHPSTGAKDKIQWPIKIAARIMSDILVDEGINLLTNGTHQNFVVIDEIGANHIVGLLSERNIKVSRNSYQIILDTTKSVKSGRQEEWFKKVAYDIADIINDYKRGNANGK